MIVPTVILLLIHSIHGTNISMSMECVLQFEEYHRCKIGLQEEFEAKARSGELEGQVENDFRERKTCNFLTAYQNCSEHFTEDCLSDQELYFLRDNEMARIDIQKNEMLPNWDPEKCPPTRHYLYRLQNGYVGFLEDCHDAVLELRSCRKRATFSYYEAIFNDEVSDYERPNLVCDLHTSVLSTCPALAPATCFSDDLLQKMNFWMFVEKSNIPEIFSYQAETCQAVKEVFDSWSEIKKFHLDALIKVYTTEELFMKNAAVNKGMIVVSKTKTINREDVDALPTILQSLRENLLDEMKEKAFKENAQAIVGLKIEIHSVFEGILNMVLYGTLASY